MEGNRERLLQAAMKGVRLHGLGGVRTQHISKLAGVSAGNIYAYFEGKDELLFACFGLVDRQIARIFDGLEPDAARLAEDPEGEVRRLWTPFYRWLVAHPDETVFYHRYCDAPDFADLERERDGSCYAGLLRALRALGQQLGITGQVSDEVLRLHVLAGTVRYAKFVVEGVLPDDASTEESVFQMEMNGLRGLLASPPRRMELPA